MLGNNYGYAKGGNGIDLSGGGGAGLGGGLFIQLALKVTFFLQRAR